VRAWSWASRHRRRAAPDVLVAERVLQIDPADGGHRNVRAFTGFGLYDRSVIEIIRSCDDRYPYFRGLIAEIGLPHVVIPYHQAKRVRGLTKNGLYTLYDMAILGITSSSKRRFDC